MGARGILPMSLLPQLQGAVRVVVDALPVWLWLLVIVSIAAIGSFLLERIVIALLRMWAKRTRLRLDDVIVEALDPGLMLAIFATSSWMAIRLLHLGFSPLGAMLLNRAFGAVFLVAVTLATVKLVKGLLRIPAQKDPRWFPLSTIGVRISVAILWAISALTLLRQFGIEITPVLATLGLASIAVGLALQPTLANFFSGLWIQTGQNLRPGNFVRLEGQKLDGFIEEVGWRTTRIRTLNGNMIIIPNNDMAGAIITNYSLPADKMGTNILVVVGFEHEPPRIIPMLEQEVRRATKEVEYILEEPEPAIRLNRAADNGWEFHCGFWVAHYWDQWKAQGDVLERVRQRFLQEGIRIPYPMAEQFAVPPERLDVARGITRSALLAPAQSPARVRAQPPPARDAAEEPASD
jgi:small-conductance mechanosensitive channel